MGGCSYPLEQIEGLDQLGHHSNQAHQFASILIRSAVPPWSHVRTSGEDYIAAQLVLSAGQTLRPVDLGVIAACGHTSLQVIKRPRVAILPTKTVLVSICWTH